MLPRALRMLVCLWAVTPALLLVEPACAQGAARTSGPVKTASGAKRSPTPQSKGKTPPKPRATTPQKKPPPGIPTPVVVTRPPPTGQPGQIAGPLFVGQISAQGAIVEAQTRAQSENRRVLIVWGSDGNRSARAFVAALRSTDELKRVVLYEYEVVLADVGDNVDRNLDIAAFYGAQLQQAGVPYITVLDPNQPLVHAHVSYFSDGREGYDTGKLLTFLRNFQPKSPLAEDVLQLGLNDARANGRVALVRFSAPAVERAVQIDAWFLRREVRGSLTNVHQVHIDIDRMIHGRDLLRSVAGSREAEAPWFALIDPKTGAVIASSVDSEGRAWGALTEPGDLLRLRDMLRMAGAPQTDEQLDLLFAPLRPPVEIATAVEPDEATTNTTAVPPSGESAGGGH